MATATTASLRRPARIVGTLLLVAVAAFAGGETGARLEWRRQEARLLTDLALKRELLHSELERHRLLPAVLSGDPQLSRAVRSTSSSRRELELEDGLLALDRRFAELAEADGSASLYLIRRDGLTVAASNHDTAASFVGNNYAFRPYFADAMSRGTGQYFAQGTVSGVAGLYLSRRLVDGSGVVVVKVEFTALERTWKTAGDRVFVVDGAGTILLASEPAARFTRLATAVADDTARVAGATSQPGWTLVLERNVAAAAWSARLFGMLAAGLAAALVVVVSWSARLLRLQRARSRQQLEELVEARTAELRLTNERLMAERDERSKSEQRVSRLRSDLVKANRLAVLGQITAGVAHEINQPLAAIRGYIDNARTYLAQDRLRNVDGNLDQVARLTERIALITQELRLFARKAPATAESVEVDVALEGARVLLDASMRGHGIILVREPPRSGLKVRANRIRLEQVLVNLLQNAIEALEGRTQGRIIVRTSASAATVRIVIEDNGPGVDPGLQPELFTPFTTGKPLGLGLGLVICRDLLAEYGGNLQYTSGEPAGAVFTIELPQADGVEP